MQNMELRPALYMLPVGLSESDPHTFLPAQNFEILSLLRVFIVENVRTARRFLRSCCRTFPIDECTFFELTHRPGGGERFPGASSQRYSHRGDE